MDALISGQAGIALVVDEGRLATIHAADPDSLIPRQPGALRFLMGDSHDFVPIEDTTREDIVRHLLAADRHAYGLDLALSLQDPALSDSLRREAAEELEEILVQEGDIGKHIENVLYSHPLPETADMAGAQAIAHSTGTQEVSTLLELVWTRQRAIRAIRAAWDAIPDKKFRGMRDRWRQTAVLQGFFREAVVASDNGSRVEVLVSTMAEHPAVRSLPDPKGILHTWLRPFVRTRAPTGSGDALGIAFGPVLDWAVLREEGTRYESLDENPAHGTADETSSDGADDESGS